MSTNDNPYYYYNETRSKKYHHCFVLLLLFLVTNCSHGFLVQQQQQQQQQCHPSKLRRIFHRQTTQTHLQSPPNYIPSSDPFRRIQQSTDHYNHKSQSRLFSATKSPLFLNAASTSSVTSVSSQQQPTNDNSNRNSNNNNQLKAFWQSIQHNKWRWLVPTLAILLLPRWVGRKSIDSLNYILETMPWKSLARVVIVIWITISIVSTIHTNRRQARDATSEWSRYAEKPGARGRAILWLLLQQACWIFAARITSALSLKDTATSIRQTAGHAFSNGLLKLGPLYIKLGQIVSCRKGLLGKEWIDAMADLQDRVPARTGQDALDLAYATLEGGQDEFDRLFVDFDSTPLAAASLGQVHRAKLRSYHPNHAPEVAVKIQRPYLRQIYNQDFVLLTTIAQFMDRLPGTSKNVGGVESSWTQIFVDAEDILYREIDYRDEAENAKRFADDFGLGLGGNATRPTAKSRNNQTLTSAADWLRTPHVYSDLSNERLLVMEYVPSIKITDRAKLDDANVTEEDRIELADNLARAYLRQFCCNLFFSTDPHPGNLGVEMVPVSQLVGDGNGMVPNLDKVTNGRLSDAPAMMKPRLVIYDFGQAATLNRHQADGILEIIEAIVDTDVDRSVQAFQKMGVLVDDANLDVVRDKVAENYRTGKVKANRKKLRRKGFTFRDDDDNNNNDDDDAKLDEGNVTASATVTATTGGNDAKVMSYFSLPAEYAFVARAISQMDGVGKSLDPEFDFISSAAPYLVEVKGADLYIKDEILKVLRGWQSKWVKFQEETIPNWWNELTGKTEQHN
ncbi:ABC1 family-domain containing protein [Nitzschia inconspicua]|uniref:ABC1 family-domain containing protein n=1 Tax=Nitzschia inconspicua TaxID=303405 RepID=A0A9K3M2C1_9STRA|nr:ABC1 family-domain containing protein [Nitzschia inconspicua]